MILEVGLVLKSKMLLLNTRVPKMGTLRPHVNFIREFPKWTLCALIKFYTRFSKMDTLRPHSNFIREFQ